MPAQRLGEVALALLQQRRGCRRRGVAAVGGAPVELARLLDVARRALEDAEAEDGVLVAELERALQVGARGVRVAAVALDLTERDERRSQPAREGALQVRERRRRGRRRRARAGRGRSRRARRRAHSRARTNAARPYPSAFDEQRRVLPE